MRRAAEEAQVGYMTVSRMVNGRWGARVRMAAVDEVSMEARWQEGAGWFEETFVDVEEVVVVEAQSAAEMSAVTGRHIRDDIGGLTVGMLLGHMVDETERERSHC